MYRKALVAHPLARGAGGGGWRALAGVLFLALAGCGGGSSAPAEVVSQSRTWVARGDFNGDGRLDLAVSSSFFSAQRTFAGEVQVFLQSSAGNGVFLAPVAYGVGADPFETAAGDVNGDGRPDLVTANQQSNSVSVLLNRQGAPGTFAAAVDYPCGNAPFSVAIGDLNQDAIPDLVVAVDNGVDILLQDPNARGQFLSPVHLSLAGGAFSVAVGDLDGDGLNDIAASGTAEVDVFFQNGPAAFSLPVPFGAGVRPNGVAVADVNRDLLDDLVVANAGAASDGSNSTVSVLIQDPVTPGNFLAARNFAVPNGAQNLAVAEIDGDLFPDIVVASTVLSSNTAGVVSVLFNDRSPLGNFLFSASYNDGFTPASVVIGDFDGDFLPDIAVQDGPGIFFQDPAHLGLFFPVEQVGP